MSCKLIIRTGLASFIPSLLGVSPNLVTTALPSCNEVPNFRVYVSPSNTHLPSVSLSCPSLVPSCSSAVNCQVPWNFFCSASGLGAGGSSALRKGTINNRTVNGATRIGVSLAECLPENEPLSQLSDLARDIRPCGPGCAQHDSDRKSESTDCDTPTASQPPNQK
jgi:hypothetical protein